jgi:hypothetical protein
MQTLQELVTSHLVEGRLSCAAALKIAKDLGISPKEVGDYCNEHEVKIFNCQLGCFK